MRLGKLIVEDTLLRGLTYLCQTQKDGTWEEPEYTGTGFPRDFYINYHLYRHVFPTVALAEARKVWGSLVVEHNGREETRPGLPHKNGAG